MLRVSEFSETAQSFHTASRSSSLVISPMRISKQKDHHSKSLRLDRQHFTALDDAELPLSNLHIREGEKRTLVLSHGFITYWKFSAIVMELCPAPWANHTVRPSREAARFAVHGTGFSPNWSTGVSRCVWKL